MTKGIAVPLIVYLLGFIYLFIEFTKVFSVIALALITYIIFIPLSSLLK